MTNLLSPFFAERDRWFLWLPVFMGLGVALYFGWPAEPYFVLSVASTFLALAVCVLLRGHALIYVFLPLLFLSLGHNAAMIETRAMNQPMLQEKTEVTTIVGRVMMLNSLPDGYRVWLNDVQVEGLAQAATPRSIRIKIRYQDERPEPGRWISSKAILYPLSRAAEPDAFNFRRYAFYQGFGATGFTIGRWRYAEGPPPEWNDSIGLFFERIRTRVAAAISAQGGGRERAVATALVTGEQSGIDQATMQAMRISGISHILSVSGLHITLVAGIVFFALRALLAMVPYLALHWPIKKIAAFAAILAAIFYTFICSAPVPAVRAMLMSSVLLIAVMADRRALSMRLVAFAALVSLFVAPSALLDPSFQLSFGAVAALIAVFEKNEHALWERFKSRGLLGKFAFYLGGSVVTSVVASIATMPFILYHFQQVNWYGVLTNLIAVPLSTFIIMPAAVIAVLAMPFGLEAWPLAIMEIGIKWMLDSAHWVAQLPGSVTYHPAMALPFIVLAASGGLWLCLWQRRWRYVGLVPFVLGTLGFLFTPRPDILVADDGITVAVRAADGRLIARAKDREDFNIRVWQQRDGHQGDGLAYALNWLDVAEQGGQGRLACAGYDCVYAEAAAFPMNKEALSGLCGKYALVVASAAPTGCGAAYTINDQAIAAGGSHAIFMKDGGVQIKTAVRANARRFWD